MKSMFYLFGLLGINLLPLIAEQPILASSSCLPFSVRFIPRQVTIIRREELARPTLHHLEDLLIQRVPSLSPNVRGNISLRGRPVSLRIDGVPVHNGDAILRGLTPEMVERIEVIPSPTLWCSDSFG